jgi:hypothetical protein
MGMKTSRPTVYKRPNPQDIYYNGNIYDPKPKEEVDKPEAASLPPKEGGGNTKANQLNKSATGLQIY